MTTGVTKAQEAYLKLGDMLLERGAITHDAWHHYSCENRDWYETINRNHLTLQDRKAADLLQQLRDLLDAHAQEEVQRSVPLVGKHAQREAAEHARREAEKVCSSYPERWTPAVVTLMNAMYQAVAAGEKLEDLTEALERGANNAIHERNKHQMPQQSPVNVIVQEVMMKSDPDAKKLPTPEWAKDLEWHTGYPFRAITHDWITLELIDYTSSDSILKPPELTVSAYWERPSNLPPTIQGEFRRQVSGTDAFVIVDGLLVQARAHIAKVNEELKRRETDARS